MDFETLEELIRQGRFDAVSEQLTDTSGIQDADVHRRLAGLCARAGLADRVLQELKLAHRDDPDDLATLKRIATAQVDAGNAHKAIKCYRQLVDADPKDVESWEELGSLLHQTAQLEEAEDAYLKAFHLTGERRFQALAQRLQKAVPQIPHEDEPEQYPSSLHCQRFVALFSGREGVFARQWTRREEAGYAPVHEPFTPQVAANHLLGNHTVGIYPLRNDNTVNFAALDLDLSKAVLRKFRRGTPGWNAAMDRLVEYALHLQTLTRYYGLPCYLEDSGSKGRHLWLFFAEPLSGRVARSLARFLFEAAGPPPQDVGVEVFPKQHQLSSDGLGNLIKLPLGIHRLTGQRAVFLEDGDPVPQEREERFLQAIERVHRRDVVELFETVTPTPEDEPEPERQAVSLRRDPLETSYHLEHDRQAQFLLSRCATLRALVQKAELDAELSHDEARVLIHTLGHLETGPAAVNALLRRCPGSEESLFLRSRLRGNPMSCPKIRARIPEVTSRLPCNCQFAPEAGLYPTPLLHLRAESVASLNSLQLQALLDDFLRVRQEIHKLGQLCRLYEERLSAWFDEAGIDRLETSMGSLVRVTADDGTHQLLLKV